MKYFLLISCALTALGLVGCSGTPSTCMANCLITDSQPNGDATNTADTATDVLHDGAAESANDVAMSSDIVDSATQETSVDALDVTSDATSSEAGPSDANDAAASDGGPCNQCFADSVSWGSVGGNIARHDSSSVASCRTFTFLRAFLNGPPNTMCMTEIPACATGNETTVSDIENALHDPDVAAAVASAPILFGRVNLGTGGAHYEININGHVISIAGPCNGLAGCTDPPSGVASLRTLLDDLTTTQLTVQPCGSTFPNG